MRDEVFDEIERIEAEIRRKEKEYYTEKALKEAYNPKMLVGLRMLTVSVGLQVLAGTRWRYTCV